MTLAEAALAQSQGRPRSRGRRVRRSRRPTSRYAEAQLHNTVIRAPFAGTVVKKMAEVGESVAPIPPGVNISTASRRHRRARRSGDARDGGRRLRGERRQARRRISPPRSRSRRSRIGSYKAVLRQIIPTADRTKATVLTKVTLLEKDKDLKPEMSAKVTFLEPQTRRRRRGRRVPSQADDPRAAEPRSSRATAARRCSRSSRARAAMRADHDRRHAQRSGGRHRRPRRQRDCWCRQPAGRR